MSDPGKLTVITNDRREAGGGKMPGHRPRTRAEDMVEMKALLDRACASIDAKCEVVDDLTKKLAQA